MPAFYEWDFKVRVPSTAVARNDVPDIDFVRDYFRDALNINADEVRHFGVLQTKAPKESDIRREQS